MNALSPSELDNVGRMVTEHKDYLREEIRVGLKRMRTEGYEDPLPGPLVGGDGSVAKLLTGVTSRSCCAEAKTGRINPFDLNKTLPRKGYPLIEVGTRRLNRLWNSIDAKPARTCKKAEVTDERFATADSGPPSR